MLAKRSRGRAGAYTLLELLRVIAVLFVLAALLWRVFRTVRSQVQRARWDRRLRLSLIPGGAPNPAQKENERSPTTLPASAGGTLEFAASVPPVGGSRLFARLGGLFLPAFFP